MSIKGELFSQQFIPKLLDGTKIRTSRPIKPQPPDDGEILGPELYTSIAIDKHGDMQPGPEIFGIYGDEWGVKSKYQPGDIIYVRETFNDEETTSVLYNADFYDFGIKEVDGYTFVEGEVKWHPSIHMPREAARIFLRVTDVKVQKLDDLTEQDAIDDGFEDLSRVFEIDDNYTALNQFKSFWLSQYNDARWMWVYCFKKCEKPQEVEK